MSKLLCVNNWSGFPSREETARWAIAGAVAAAVFIAVITLL
jgi:hypothetical protein|tara:strand:+ start:5146 stop:5268 length:123 start_codon:yes stop_codon:yes gene_type:complete